MLQQTVQTVGCNIVEEDGLFKATLLWEKIVAHLEKSIKCGRHTQSLRTYTNCFQGSKAVDCLLVHLNTILPKTVKRHQVQTLCQKLVLTGVIEDVKDKDKSVFREGRLYSLTRNHFWANPMEMKLPRTRSAELICTEKESAADDLKGYASDSTISHSAWDHNHTTHSRKKKRCKDRESHHTPKERKTSHHQLLAPDNSACGMLRMKSAHSILKAADSTPTFNLCESRESLLSSVFSESHESLLSAGWGGSRESLLPDMSPSSRHRRNSHHRRAPATTRPEPGHSRLYLRRGSVDSASTRMLNGGGGSIFPCKPPLHTNGKRSKTRDDRSPTKTRDARHLGQGPVAGPGGAGKVRCRHPSRSLKGEKDRRDSTSKLCCNIEGNARPTLNRSLSLSSVGDYAEARARPSGMMINLEPIHSASSGSKWIVYGFI